MAKKYYKRKYKEAILEDKKDGDWFLFMLWEQKYFYTQGDRIQNRQYEEAISWIKGERKSAIKQARKIAKQYGLNRDIILR